MKDRVYCQDCKHIFFSMSGPLCGSNPKGDAISPQNGKEQARVKNANNDCKEFEERPLRKKSFYERICGI